MPNDRFPPAGKFTIKSHPILLVSRNDESEVVVFDATMEVQTRAAKVRFVDFTAYPSHPTRSAVQ